VHEVSLFPQPDARARRVFLLRLCLVVALVTMCLTVTQLMPGRAPFRPAWGRTPTATPLHGDILYRLSQHLKRHPAGWHEALGLNAHDMLQSAIASYERLALTADDPSTTAMYRLAIIYAKQRFPQQSLELLSRLVMLDEENAPLYFAVSSVYDTAPVKREDLQKLAPLLGRRHDWVARMVAVDWHRRMGMAGEAADDRALIARQNSIFCTAFVTVAAIYALLGLTGLVLLAGIAWRKLFRAPAAPVAKPPLITTWGPFDAVEAAAVLLACMVVAGVLSNGAMRTWRIEATAPGVVPVLAMASYLLFCAPVLVLIWYRAGRSRGAMRALGFAEPVGLQPALYGLAGYAVLLALAAILSVAVGLTGQGQFPVAAQSVIELVQKAHGAPQIAVYLVLLCVIAPVVEETVFRGFVYAGLRRRFGALLAIPLSALLFGLAHLSLAIGGMLAVSVIGALLAYLYERSRTLWPSIIAHGVHNLLTVSIVIAGSI